MKKLFVFLALTFLGVFIFINNKGKVAGVSTEEKSNYKNISGIIMPHHALAEELIFLSYEKIKENQYTHVVLIGPNHFQPEVNSIVTSRSVSPAFDNEVTSNLLQTFPEILDSDEIVADEHSIMLHIPYLKNYFPDAKITPLIVSPYSGKTDLFAKMDFLTSILPEQTLFIASVDFAHNLMREEALINNEESISSIENFDYEKIYKYKDDHMDSPLSIAMFLKFMELRGFLNWETWFSSHGSILENDPGLQGTSYVLGAFSK